MPVGETYQEDSLTLVDTVYGIENEELIPVRHTEVIIKEKQPIEKVFKPETLVVGVESWQTITLLIAVLLIGVVKSFSNNRYRLGIKALFNYSVAQEIVREEQVFFHRSNIFLTIGHLLSASLFVYELRKIIINGEYIPTGFSFFLLILGAITVIYIVKYIFSKVLLFVFNDTTSASEYIFNVSLYNNLLGVLLIPILCVSYFTPLAFPQILLYVAIPITFLVFLLRVARLFVIGRTIGVLYVYIFLYICTLEILPLVVLYRIFIR